VIIIHYGGTLEAYVEAKECLTRTTPIPACCPHCGAKKCLIRWGFYRRWCYSGQYEYYLVIQRVRCKGCGRTHALLPDFLHPYRRYALDTLSQVVMLYLLKGQSYGRIYASLPEQGPAYTTIREWVAAFAYGAGQLLLPGLVRDLTALDLEIDPPPPEASAHLKRIRSPEQRQRLEQAHHFLWWSERLYAWVKNRQARLHFAAESLLAFVLHWLQSRGLPPRIFWHEGLPGTPNTPF
jgi:transposase-like protein